MTPQTVQRRAEATLDAFVEQVKLDDHILAVIVCCSLSHDQVWEKSDIDLIVICDGGKKAKPRGLVWSRTRPTIRAGGKRYCMESLSSCAKRFIAQVVKSDMDFMFGLLPVISIKQNMIVHNPRSTVGTLTDSRDIDAVIVATPPVLHAPVTVAGDAVG